MPTSPSLMRFATAAFSLLLLARPAFSAEPACQPYSVVNKASITACPAGYQGVRYKTTTKVCPGGAITISKDFITKDCVPMSSGGGGNNGGRAIVNCSANADTSCQNPPGAADCPAKMRWSLAGTGVAHCVLVSAECGSGQMEIRDANDNPSCKTCTATASSTSGACPTGYNGSIVNHYSTDSCTNVTTFINTVNTCVPNCYLTESSTNTACPAGQGGSIITTYNTDSCTGTKTTTAVNNTCYSCSTSSWETAGCGAGNYGSQQRLVTSNSCTGSTSYGNWDASGCSPCASTSYEYAACPSGYTGNLTRAVNSNACTGSVSYDGWSSASCSPCESTSTEYGACPSGQTGNTTRSVTSNACTGSTSYGSWSSASCSPCETTSTEYGSCPSGQTGNTSRAVTSNVCNGTTSYGSWSNASCSPCETTSTEYGKCSPSQTGNTTRTVTDNVCTGAKSTSAWSSAGCTDCVSSTTESAVCGGDMTGNKFRTVTTDKCNNTTSVGSWDTSACQAPQVPSCNPGSNWRTEPCDSGYSGNKKVTDTTTCPWGIYGPPYTTQTIDTSACIVQSPPPQPPAPCPENYYYCVPWKPEYMKMYEYRFSGPSCIQSVVYLGLYPDGSTCTP